MRKDTAVIEPMSDALLADIRERATRELEAEEADFLRGARMRPLLPTPAHRQQLLLDEVDRLRAELNESQRWFDALVTADKAQQGAADWLLNRLLVDKKIDQETYNALAGLLRDQINAKMCLLHPDDWTPLIDRHRKALAELAELREQHRVLQLERGVLRGSLDHTRAKLAAAVKRLDQMGSTEDEWGYGNEPDDVDPIGDRNAARDCAQAYGASIFVRSITSGPWRLADADGQPGVGG